MIFKAAFSGNRKNWNARALLGFSLILLSAGIVSCHNKQTPAASEAATQAKSAVAPVPSGFRVPAGYTTEQKPWKANPGYTVLLADGPSSSVANTAILAISKGGTIIASGTDKDDDCDVADDNLYSAGASGTSCKVALDLAPYRISDNEFAFGIRWHEDETFPAGENNADELRLFRVDGSKLTKLLETRMTDNDEQRGPNEGSSNDCTLSISATKTLGHFDLIKKCAGASAPLMEPDDGPAPKPKKYSSRILFKWDGSKYVEQKGNAGPK